MKRVYVRFVGDRPDSLEIENVWYTRQWPEYTIVKCFGNEEYTILMAAVAYLKETEEEDE